MSESLSDFETRVFNWHRVPAATVDADQQTQAITSAVTTYSGRAPLQRTVELSASTTNEWALASEVSGWADGYTVCGASYEAGDGNLVPVDSNGWRVIRRGSADYLRVFGAPCSDGLWLEYSAPHVVAELAINTTIPLLDLDAVAKLAAAECCRMAARVTSDVKTSSYTADTVDYSAIPNAWKDRANELESEYKAHMDSRYTSGSGYVDLDSQGVTGRGTLFHRYRSF